MSWPAIVLSIVGVLSASVVAFCFLVGAWHGIDRREAARKYSDPRSSGRSTP